MAPDTVLILDATCAGDPACPPDYTRWLQEVIATYLAWPLLEVERAWLAVNLSETRQNYAPDKIYTTSLPITERELAKLEAVLALQGKTLQGLQTILVVDDAAPGCNSVLAGLAVQVYKRTHVDPMVIGVQETARDAWLVVDAIPEPGEVDWLDPQTAIFLRLLGLIGKTFDRFALLTVAKVGQVKSIGQLSPISPVFDAACAELEQMCVDAQEMLACLLATTQLLPIHAVVTRAFPQLPASIDEQSLWDMESIACWAFAQACALDKASEDVARDAAQTACVHWVLQRLGGQSLLDLPDDLVHLIACVLEQVGHWAFRRFNLTKRRGGLSCNISGKCWLAGLE